jgi:hypothetical protein
MAATVRSIEGGKRNPRLTFALPEYGSPEFWLWVLVLTELGILIWIRAAFRGANGG